MFYVIFVLSVASLSRMKATEAAKELRRSFATPIHLKLRSQSGPARRSSPTIFQGIELARIIGVSVVEH
jgi:hypothetical protein